MNVSKLRFSLLLFTLSLPLAGMASVTATDDTLYAHEKAASINVTANDVVSGATITSLKITRRPKHGVVVVARGSLNTIIYTPGRRYSGSDSFAYTIKDSTKATSTATVHISDPYAVYGGARQGLVSSSSSLPNDSTGFVNLMTATDLSFSAAVTWKGLTYRFKGQFPTSLDVVEPLAEGANVELNLLSEGGPSAKVTTGTTVADGLLTAPLSNGKSDIPAQAGAYATKLSVPTGSSTASTLFANLTGYVSMTVLKTGRVLTVGKLPDGTNFTSGSFLNQSGSFPIYSGLYGAGARGAVRGLLQIDSSSHISQELSWTKPSDRGANYYPVAIETPILAEGDRYVRATLGKPSFPVTTPSGTNAKIQFNETNGAGVSSYQYTLNISAKNRATILGNNPLQVQVIFAGATGLFHGTFRNPLDNNRKVFFQGLVYQQDSAAYGIFSANHVANGVVILPAQTAVAN